MCHDLVLLYNIGLGGIKINNIFISIFLLDLLKKLVKFIKYIIKNFGANRLSLSVKYEIA
jgi:hypothetical protein